MIQGLQGLQQLLSKLRLRESFIDQLNGQEVSKRRVILTPFLHQGSENSSEQESAQFERENQDLFDQMRKNQQDIGRTLK